MAKKVYEEANIAAIASKIREKTGGDTTYKTSEMPSGVDEVYEKGKQAEYDEFWDNFQDYGNRRYYYYGFINVGGYWNKQTFKPKYDIILEGNASFAFYAWENCPEDIDIGAILKEQGVTIDTSKATNIGSLFNSGKNIIGELPTISCESAGANTASLFRSVRVTKIEKLIVTEQTVYTHMFTYCSLLEDIVFEGKIAQNGFNVQWSTKLTHDSLMSIINALKDYSGTDTWNTITLGSDNIAKLTADELLIMQQKQWNYV